MKVDQSSQSIGIFLHVFYPDVVDEVLGVLANIRGPLQVYVSTDSAEKQAQIEKAFACAGLSGELLVKILPNLGRDIAPFLVGFRDEILAHDVCLRLHTKKSTHAVPEWGAAWRRHLLLELAGSVERCDLVRIKFSEHPRLGFLTAIHWPHIAHWVSAGDNFDALQALLAQIGLRLSPEEHIEFPTGGMFWFRGAALKPLLDLKLSWDRFSDSNGEDRDATLAHAIERCFFYVGATAGFAWAVLPSGSSANALSTSEAMPIVSNSGLFDREFYCTENPDVAAAGVDPLEHYFLYGYREGRNPSASFETEFYKMLMESNEDMNPLLHYLLRGRQAGFETSSSMLMPDRTKPQHEHLLSRFEKVASAVNGRPA